VKSAETNVRPHVYSIALELGAEIRLNRPLDRITSLLDDLLDTHVSSAPQVHLLASFRPCFGRTRPQNPATIVIPIPVLMAELTFITAFRSTDSILEEGLLGSNLNYQQNAGGFKYRRSPRHREIRETLRD